MSRSLAAWAILAAIVLAINLGSYPLLDPDEGRNGEVGREMAETNDYVMPRLDGMPYLDKPIVYFASEAAVMEVTGPTEFAARFPAWLFTIATAALLTRFAVRVGIDAPIAVIMFLSMPLTIAFARTVIFDSALSFFITSALVAFYLAIENDDRPLTVGGGTARGERRAASGNLAEARTGGGQRPVANRWTAAAWAAMAFGVITKGPVALAVPLIVAIPFAIWRKRARALISFAGVILFVIIIAPWVWAISRAVPDFLRYVLVTETAQRLATKALKRTGAPWYFVPYLFGGALPWIFCVRTGFRRARQGEAGPHAWLDRYLMLWVLVPFVFFSLSQSKRPQYILPLMPAVALLAAGKLRTRSAGVALALFGAIILGALPFAHVPFGEGTAIILAASALICGIIGIFTRPKLAVIAISIPMLLIPIITAGTLRSLGGTRSEKALAADLRPYAGSGDIVGIEAFTGSMAFYLQHPIIVVSPTGEEFTSNYITRHYSDFSARLKPPQWLAGEFQKRGTLYVVRINDKSNRALVEAHGGTLVAQSAHFAAYTIAR
ncbi:MAG TPA: phospholipid carrier-dependent glycosyltransferase [Thermoanaerobaculia bacterium]|nr:phospholipid carrier-dependent glycosyltransferase [Thermoanaerobaculia bacterium]